MPIIHRADEAHSAHRVDLRRDVDLNQPCMSVGHVAGDDQAGPGPMGDVDGQMGPLDLLDPSQEHQWGVRGPGRTEVVSGQWHAVGNHRVQGADVLDVADHPAC